MGKGAWMHPNHEGLPLFSMDEIARHTERTDRWLAVNGYVYDITNFAKQHPGGEKIITGYAGEDASEAWYAFHPHKENVTKFMASIVVGRVREEKDSTLTEEKVKEMSLLLEHTLEHSQPRLKKGFCRLVKAYQMNHKALLEDFHQIRDFAEKSGFFRPNPAFFILCIAQVFLFEFLGWWTLATFGTGWLPFFAATFFLVIVQIQSGWSQHDFGHLSVFKNRRLDHCIQTFLMNVVKGGGAHWWNFRHNNHHAKPNVLNLDPDVSLAPIILVGETVPKEYGTKKKRVFPYIFQHKYFFFIIPPFLVPIYFNLEILYFVFKRKLWQELFWISLFFGRWYLMYAHMLGGWGVFALYVSVRFFESHWFFWASQMSHIPMYIDYDQKGSWVSSQIKASCNVEHSWFNDWWSGHLNLQIEHHLFPTMPRHNLSKVAPLVRSMCEKHYLVYLDKPALMAFGDIVRSLKTSGQIWQEAYNNS